MPQKHLYLLPDLFAQENEEVPIWLTNHGSAVGPLANEYSLLFLVILFWGINWPIMKLGVQHMPPLWFATARIFLGALFFVRTSDYSGQIHIS